MTNPDVDEVVEEWCREVEHALRICDARLRRELKFPPVEYKWVSIARTQNQKFLLLNWKVWTLRHHVSLTYVVGSILRIYQRIRRPSATPAALTLGLPVRTITSERSRLRFEEDVARDFPNGENVEAWRNQKEWVPIEAFSYDGPDEMVKRYDEIMTERHRKKPTPATGRAWRQE